MEFLKELFSAGALTFEQFSQAVEDKGIKLADLATGNYVDKSKYDDDIQAKDTQIKTLNGNLKTRDENLETLKKQLKDAGTNAGDLAKVTADLEKLQGDYAKAEQKYKDDLTAVKCEFAVKEFANGQKFTSEAAKRDFISHIKGKNPQLGDNGEIIGASDYLNEYKQNNADCFVVDEPKDPKPPSFVQPTGGQDPKPTNDPFLQGLGM